MNQIYRNRVTYSVGELCEVCIIHPPLGKPIDQQKTLSVKKKQTHDSSKSYITYEVVPSIHIHSTCIYIKKTT